MHLAGAATASAAAMTAPAAAAGQDELAMMCLGYCNTVLAQSNHVAQGLCSLLEHVTHCTVQFLYFAVPVHFLACYHLKTPRQPF